MNKSVGGPITLPFYMLGEVVCKVSCEYYCPVKSSVAQKNIIIIWAIVRLGLYCGLYCVQLMGTLVNVCAQR